MNKNQLSAAYFKTLRESLGLTAQWIANQNGVQLRTVTYWEAGRQKAPSRACNMLVSLDENFTDIIDKSIMLIKNATEKPQEIILIRYRTSEDLWHYRPDMATLPVSAHAALLARLARKIKQMSITPAICYMDTDRYEAWRGERQDSELLRMEWAAAS